MYANLYRKIEARKSFALVLLTLGLTSCGRAGEVLLEIENPPASGLLSVMIFDSANDFSDLRQPLRSEKLTLNAGNQLVISNLPTGKLVIMLHEDANGNRLLDRNVIGIPVEPIGFSNAYEPKGPPNFEQASFVLSAGESKTFPIRLRKPLGDLGRIGVGPVMLARSSPYRDYDRGVYRILPGITYIGERFQWYGPNLQIRLAGRDRFRLAATASVSLASVRS